MGKQITKSQWYEIVGLLAVAKRHDDAMNEIIAALMSVTGEEKTHPSDTGHCGDAVYSGYSADKLLENIGITVAPDPEVN